MELTRRQPYLHIIFPRKEEFRASQQGERNHTHERERDVFGSTEKDRGRGTEGPEKVHPGRLLGSPPSNGHANPCLTLCTKVAAKIGGYKQRRRLGKLLGKFAALQMCAIRLSNTKRR